MRQPGSSFKPFVYAAALDNGYTPASVVMDAPIEIRIGNEVWPPENYGGKFDGPSTLRTGIEKSRNVMTVRLAQDMGMPLVAEYAERFGIYDELLPVSADGARLRRDDGAAHGLGLCGDRQWRPEDQADADRPHPGPLRQDRSSSTTSATATAATPTNWTDQAEPELVDNASRCSTR